MSSSSTNRRPSATGPRPRTVFTNRREWIPRSSPSFYPSDHPHPRHIRRSYGQDSPATNPDKSSLPQLVHEIQEKLARGAVECMICYDMVHRSAPIWSCQGCFSIFHLHCIRKWARSPTSAADPTPSSSGDWRCPGCQAPQSTPAKDISYICFCGRRRDPPNDLYLTPHSCGESCGKLLYPSSLLLPGGSVNGVADREEDDLRCPHVCVLQCHPGPCPPCKAFAPRRRCPCGKTDIVRRCSDRIAALSCGQPCGLLLACGRHHCERPCHSGSCGSCQELITASCFCDKKTEAVLCGDMVVKGEFNDKSGLFSCNMPCDKNLLCGSHACGENCHPGPCGECELLPGKIKSCYCGKTSLTGQRNSCLDPISTCSQVCGKPLICKTHICKLGCHEGNCPPCLAPVEQKCRCGSSRKTVECYQLFDERFSFTCEKICGWKKNCGRHRCSERCCPLSKPGRDQISGGDWDLHLCSIPCGKRLRCGNHLCQLLCHSGHCQPCLETIFSDLSCACGKTSIPPPIPCGTPVPSCPQPCSVPQPCGHPASHSCHFGDCPPCTYPMMKECIGGHVMLRNIPCGSKDIRCNQLCGKTRQCGIHACARNCHPSPCDSSLALESGGKLSCGQVCGAPRRDCKHTCTAPCHPSSPCPEERCDFVTTISCSCGRITATVPCGAGGSSSSFNKDTLLEASIIRKLPVPLQPIDGNGKKANLGQRQLSCDEECDKVARKKQLAEAFDVTQPNLDSLHFGEGSGASEALSELMRREPKWVIAVEDRFKFMVLGKAKPGGNSMKVHVFFHMLKEKRDAVRFMAERWKLSVHYAGWEPKRFVVVHVTPKSKPPARILFSKPGVAIASQPLAYDPLIDMDPRFVVAMLDLPRDADISALVLRFGGECELVWLNDKNALAIFSDPVRAATALRRLDHGSPYHGAVIVIQSGSSGSMSAAAVSGGNAWAGSVHNNLWKRAVAPAADSWGPDLASGENLAVPVWRRSDGSPILATGNRWHALDSDIVQESASPREDCRLLVKEGDSAVDSLVDRGIVDVGAGPEVDNWEEACE